MFFQRTKLFSLMGLPVWIDASWFIVAALVTWTLATGVFPQIAPGYAVASYWLLGLVGAIGFFASIVLHELSHALVARRFEIPIAGITLFVFGGVAELHKEPKTAMSEFSMAVVGPIVSAVLGALLLLAAALSEGAAPLWGAALLTYLGTINLALAVFNMVPAFPLDGGRVLRAGLWSWTGDFSKATFIAARAGQLFGLLLIAIGLWQFVRGALIGGVWLFFIGLFLNGAAGAALREGNLRAYLGGRRVSEFMQRQPISVEERISIRSLVEQYFYRYFFKAFPVVRDGQLVGCIMARQVRDVAREDWDRLTVGDVMQPCQGEIIVPPDADVLDALAAMQRGHHRLLVVESGQLRGVLVLSDLARYLSLKDELEHSPRANAHDGRGGLASMRG